MREIKFRALELDSPSGVNWVYGYYVETNGYFMNEGIPDLSQPITRHYIFSDNGFKYEIAEDTVGQFIELKDIDGTPIYEGDIMSPKHYQKVSFGNAAVEFKKCMFCFAINKPFIASTKPLTQSLGYGSKANNHFIVIGNIHENPELLGK